MAIAPTDLFTEPRGLRYNLESCKDSALCVRLSGLVGAKHREDAIACILQDAPAQRLDNRSEGLHRPVEYGMHILWVKNAGQAGRTHDIDEEYGDVLQLLVVF